jgi:hypothetical protein
MSQPARHVFAKKTGGPFNGPNSNTVVKRISGSHQRRAGLQRVYSYEGSYGVNSEGTWYMVSVRSGGRMKGTPMGALVGQNVTEISRLHDMIVEQIEDLDQVSE